MDEANDRERQIQTDAGPFPLHEYRLRLAGREWSILHTHSMLTHGDEARFFRELRNRVPYGVALWPAAIAMAHEVASRAAALRGRRVLELGAGTGLPGIVAASFGAQVTQTDRHELALAVCKRNSARNAAQGLEQRLGDWADWSDEGRYDWIVGSDILYAEAMHPHLRRIFATNLAAEGRIMLADPFREASLRLLEELEAQGWGISVSTWSVGEEEAPRTIGLFELAPPRDA
jgi:predicted nicotinamide N-methyase